MKANLRNPPSEHDFCKGLYYTVSRHLRSGNFNKVYRAIYNLFSKSVKSNSNILCRYIEFRIRG
jgi:hypothetical protein